MPREELPKPIRGVGGGGRRHQLPSNFALHWKVIWRKLKFQKGVVFMWSIIDIEVALLEWWRKSIYSIGVIQLFAFVIGWIRSQWHTCSLSALLVNGLGGMGLILFGGST